jgi:L-aspartate oxidase
MEHRYDFLVIGSGIAGLFYALRVVKDSPDARVAVITKKGIKDTSTNRAQGGIAAVLDGTDSFQAHLADTLEAGAGLCNKSVAEEIIEAGPSAIEELVQIGVRFTRTGEQFDLGREGGHSANRVLHSSDLTGREIERALLRACRDRRFQIEFLRDHIALDLITHLRDGQETCAGAFVFSEIQASFKAVYAPVTLLATGGLGQVYFHTTNPKIATGDGVAIAYRAGASIANLEFIQFHPTTLYAPGRFPFLISEAVRGEGAILKTVDGRAIMETVHELKDLAPRDVVARAIDRELKESGEDFVLLDISHIDADRVKKRFPNIYSRCLKLGFDMTKQAVPVVPAAHYSCGGVVSTVRGETDLPGLFVAGEVAMTGMHGANRLASNSLLEAVVMARFAAKRSVEYIRDAVPIENIQVDRPIYSSLNYPRSKILIAHDRRQLTQIMSDFVGIVRTEERLKLALERVRQLNGAIEDYYLATPATYQVVELRNMATVAELIISSALQRKESRGLHYVEEYPQTDPAFDKDSIIAGPLRKGNISEHST